MSSSAVQQALNKGTLEKCKVADLKAFLKEKKLVASGEKGTMIWRINAYIDCQDLLIDGTINPLLLRGAKLRKACAQRGLSCIGNDDEMHELLVSYQKEHVTPTTSSTSTDGKPGSSSSGSNVVDPADEKRMAAIELAKKVLNLSDEGDYEGILCLLGAKISSTSTTGEMRKQYLKLSVIIHPDKLKGYDKATRAFQGLVTAFDRLSQPELYEEKDDASSKSKAQTIMRTNDGCYRTKVRCPRCKSPWGLAVSGTPDYFYNVMMQGLKTFCCADCLLEFGCCTAIHECPFCKKSFEYDPSDYHRHVTCGNQKCTKTFGFYVFKMSARYEKNLRLEIKEEQLKMMKKREQLQQRAARGKRKNIEQSALENQEFQEKLFLKKLIDECPRCGEIPKRGKYEDLQEHLKECNDAKKQRIHRKQKAKEEEQREAKKQKVDKQANVQSLKVWEYLGAEQGQMYLLSEEAVKQACQEKDIETEGLDRNDMIANLAVANSQGNGALLLTDGKSKGKVKKLDFTRESLPQNMYDLSVDQLMGVCACHGYKPKNKTKHGIIREIENQLEKSEAKGDAKLMLEYQGPGKGKTKGNNSDDDEEENFDSDGGDDDKDGDYDSSD